MSKRSLLALICIAAILLLQIPTIALADAVLTPFTNTVTPPIVDGITITMPTDPATNRTITMAFDMTQERWEKAFAEFTYDAYISIPFVLQLPATASATSFTGTSAQTSDTDAISYLQSGRYDPLNPNKTVTAWVEIARIAFDGTTAIITPISLPHSFCLKWKDNSDVEHFHRLDFAVTQQSTKACKIFSAVPDVSRIVFQSGSGITSSYMDGVVTYSVESAYNNNNIETFIKAPAGATKLNLNGEDINFQNGVSGFYIGTPVCNSHTAYPCSLQWKDNNSIVVKAECLTIVVVPTAQEQWLDNIGEPVPAGRMGLATGAQRDTVTKHLTYDAGHGKWLFRADANYDFDHIALCGGEWIFRITHPDGAVSYKIASGTGPLHNAGFENVSRNLLDGKPNAIPLTDPSSKHYTDGSALKFTLDGDILSKATLNGSDLTVYTVNKTMSGYGSWMVFQWFDENNVLSTTEYVYLVKEAFVRETESEVLQSEPQSAVTDPTAVFSNSGFKLKAQTPLQKEGGSDDWLYQLNELKFVDSNGNEVAPTDAVQVYLPYPEGAYYGNVASFNFTLRHYTDNTYENYIDIIPIPTEYGLMFQTNSFSPFLLGWKPGGSSNNSGSGSSGYSINAPSFSYPLQNTQVNAAAGISATMSVSASGTGAISYQWQINRGNGWSNIAGATRADYYTSLVDAANDGYQYRCVVSNAYGTVTSHVFELQVMETVGVPKTGDQSISIVWLVIGLFVAAIITRTTIKREQQR